MFKKLLKLFLDEKTEPETTTISQDELEDWIIKIERARFDSITQEIGNIRARIEGYIKNAHEHLEKLKSAELINKNIPKRAEQIMQGNRERYVKKVSDFLLKVEPDFASLDDMKLYTGETVELTNELGRANKKSNMVLNEFFSDQVKSITICIGNIIQDSEKIQDLLKEKGLMEIDSVKNEIAELNDIKKSRLDLKKQTEKLKKGLEEKNEQCRTLELRLKELEDSEAYKEVRFLKDKKKEVEANLKQAKDDFVKNIHSIEPGLKRFSRATMNKETITEYLDNPVEALLHDDQMLFVSELVKLKLMLKNDEIDMKEKKKEKLLSMLSNLNDITLNTTKTDLNSLKEQRTDIERKLQKRPIISEQGEIDYQLDHIKSRARQISSEIESLAKTKEKFKDKDILRDIRKNVKEKLDIVITIN